MFGTLFTVAAIPGGKGDGDEFTFGKLDIFCYFTGAEWPFHDDFPGSIAVLTFAYNACRFGIALFDVFAALIVC